MAGVLAGFSANGFIMAALQLGPAATADPDRALRAAWEVALAMVLSSSAFARLRTHFALTPDIPYSLGQFAADLLLVGVASLALATVDTAPIPSEAFWLLLILVGILLLARNLYLAVYHGYLRVLGTWLLALGLLASVVLCWAVPTSSLWAAKLAIAVIGAALVQFILETRA